jgi:O-antigen/teichoic acid export membrane protein
MLLPGWGLAGAAAGRASIIILIAILQFLVLKRKKSVDLDFRMVAKTFIAGTIMAAVVAVAELLYYGKFLLPVYALIGTVVYLLMVRSLRVVNAADLELLRNLLGRRLASVSGILGRILLPDHSEL